MPTEAEYEKLIGQLRQELVNERRMWKSAVRLALSEPYNIGLIGDPGKSDEIRETLRPIAELVAAVEDLRHCIKQNEGEDD